MKVRKVPCPECGRVHHITNQTETRCICGSRLDIERDRTVSPIKINLIKKS